MSSDLNPCNYYWLGTLKGLIRCTIHILCKKRKIILGDKFLISQEKFYSLCVSVPKVASPPYKLKAGILTPLQASHAIKFTWQLLFSGTWLEVVAVACQEGYMG